MMTIGQDGSHVDLGRVAHSQFLLSSLQMSTAISGIKEIIRKTNEPASP